MPSSSIERLADRPAVGAEDAGERAARAAEQLPQLRVVAGDQRRRSPGETVEQATTEKTLPSKQWAAARTSMASAMS